MGKHKWLLIILISLILSQSHYIPVASSANTTSGTDDWAGFRNDPSHSGYTTSSSSNDSAKLLWTYKTNKMVTSSPAVANGCVFVGSWDGQVYCLNASNGEPVWKYATGNEVGSSPTIYNNFVYVGSDGGYVFCLDIATGAPLWNATVGGFVRSSPTVVEDRVYVGSGVKDVFCLNASDGTTIWTYPTLYRVQSSPAVSDGIVYVGSDEYWLYAFNASTGDEIWSSRTTTVISSPSVHNGYVYVGSRDGYIWGLNASTGSTIWEYETGDAVDSSPAVAYGCVYVGSEDNNFYCLNASNGEKVWQSPTEYRVWSSPVVADGKVYVGSQDHNIYCFDAFTGEEKWSYETGNFVDSSPAVVNGNLFVGSSDGYVYAFALGDSTDALPPQSADVHWTTIVFDVVACVVAVATVFTLVRCFYLNRKAKQSVEDMEISGQTVPWFSKHGDALCISAIMVFSTIFLVDLGGGPLWAADEKVYSHWAYHMFKSGDYLTPWAYGNVSMWLAKPPLFMWLMSLSYQVFGVSHFSTRLWNPVFGTLCLILIFYLGKKLYNRYVGFLSALVLGTFTTFNVFARRAMTDVPLVFFIMASIYFLLLAEKGDNTNRYAALGGLFFGLAFMTKQIAALLVPLIVFTYFIAMRRGIWFFFKERFDFFWQVGFLIVAPWMIYMVLRFGPDFWGTFFGFSGVTRIVSPIEGHVGDWFYYFDFLINRETLFWVILLPFAAGLCVFNSIVKRLKEDTLIVAWMFVVLVLITVVQTKIEWYILPVFPAFSMAIGSFLYQTLRKAPSVIGSLHLAIVSVVGNVLRKAKT